MGIGRETYSRRCRKCWHTSNYPIMSTVKKKVVYVDQFAISNMMKAIDVAAKAHDRAAADPFWLPLFEQLERVCKLQLAICPDSPSHRDESMVSPFYDALKRMYEQLSHGVTFDSHQDIQERQTFVALSAWLSAEQPIHELNPERITHGDLYGWQDRLIVTVSGGYPADMAESIRANRDSLHRAMGEWFERCRGRTDKSFEYALNIELDGCRDGLVGAYRDWLQRSLEVGLGRRPFALDDLLPSSSARQVQSILETLKHRGAGEQEALVRMNEFLSSEAFRDTPTNRISTRMFASIAHQAANGRTRPPNRGMSNDINVVSSLMPYCDAMLVDNECRAMLANIPKAHALGYPTRVFSPATGTEFLDYLRLIESDAPREHLAEVRAVYGDDWSAPFLNMYEVEREMEARRRARPST